MLNELALLAFFSFIFWCMFAVRGFVTGSTDTSLWTVYNKGVRNYCGNVLPEGIFIGQYLLVCSYIQVIFVLFTYCRNGKESEATCKYTYSYDKSCGS